MAEFQDVMKQAKRMCEAQNDCEECPIGANLDCVCVIGDLIEMMDAKKIESIVMDWAKKNPEPVYPTWTDGWKQVFPNGSGVPCPADLDLRYKPDGGCSLCASCEVCKDRPIPADLAEKLGIKPIGGSNDEN